MDSKKKSFTFIELIITTVIIGLAGLAISTVFYNGIKIWRRATIDKTDTRRLLIGLEKITRRLSNSFEFSGIDFEGEEDIIHFPTLIENDNESLFLGSVGKVTYFLDKDKNALIEQESNYSQIYQEKEGKSRVIIPAVSEFSLSYCYLDNATGTFMWKDSWEKEEQDTLPLAVKFKLIF
ncbi:MAG: type II secretion system GspH family protein, partial [Candidatus Omnitrophica bacterium]|nr:type II secretion system GspH family protein [Candidatus Omnitrophota bacterium]